MNNFDLIIFDCDGVLVDSERIANEAFANLLNDEFGLSLSLDDMFEIFVGHSSHQCIEIIEGMLGKKPPGDLEARYKNEINLALSSSVARVNGIGKAISDITIPYCVASSGSHEKMKLTLGKTNLLQFFENKLYSTSDVSRDKPFPDIYLHAAQNMGIADPSTCLVVEDSPLGVKGGVNAGMTVFGFSELSNAKKLLDAGAHHIFDRMDLLATEINNFLHE